MISSIKLAIAHPTLAHGILMLVCLLLALACLVFAAYAWDEQNPQRLCFAEFIGILGMAVMFCASFMQWGWF